MQKQYFISHFLGLFVLSLALSFSTASFGANKSSSKGSTNKISKETGVVLTGMTLQSRACNFYFYMDNRGTTKPSYKSIRTQSSSTPEAAPLFSGPCGKSIQNLQSIIDKFKGIHEQSNAKGPIPEIIINYSNVKASNCVLPVKNVSVRFVAFAQAYDTVQQILFLDCSAENQNSEGN